MKQLLTAIFFFFAISLFAQTADSVLVKRYNDELARLRASYNNRMKELADADPIINRITGAVQILEKLKAEAKKEVTKQEEK